MSDRAVHSGVRDERRIEVRLRELNQLFDSLDPSPFHEKDLDGKAEEFIVSWAGEYTPDTPIVLRLHLPESQRPRDAEQFVQGAVQKHFAYRADLARLELRRTLQQGRTSLVVGILFLALCMGARQLLSSLVEGEWGHVAAEGLLIVGWVAMWKPLELLLYDWWPVLRRRRTYANLSRMRVEVFYTSETGPAVRSSLAASG